ncbi:hypothetical protein AB833_12635 [Chromatiales bacterium (ex Bugula neritina AB1)]|nr:hypothetical protein AB833_12635 [Chromatiales bacterium (ex Bugula neritina AB1)]
MTSGPEVTASKSGGQGRRTVFLHGFGSDSQSWVGTIPALCNTVECWTVDLPGHGQSNLIEPANTMNGLAAQLAASVFVDDEPIHLVGHSLGGGLAMALTVLYPHRVKSLALMAPLGLGSVPYADFLTRFPELTDEQETFETLLTLVHRSQFISPMFAPLVLQQLDRQGVRSALRSIAVMIAESGAEHGILAEAVARLKVECLVIWGAQDRISALPLSFRESFAAQWQVFEECGHLPHIEHRAATNKLLTDFLTPAP